MAIPPNSPTMIVIPWKTAGRNTEKLIEEFVSGEPHLNPRLMLRRDREIESRLERTTMAGIVIVISHEAPASLLIEFLNHIGLGAPVTINPFPDKEAYRLRYPGR